MMLTVTSFASAKRGKRKQPQKTVLSLYVQPHSSCDNAAEWRLLMILKDKLTRILAGESENHILPFFWQHGEDDDILKGELHNIYDSGARAVCIESRPHEEFARKGWFDDVRVILDECRKLGMEAWILDDKYFPTGFCNGVMKRGVPHRLGKRAITEKHMDIFGPIKDGAVIFDGPTEEDGWADKKAGDELLAIIACRCEEGPAQALTGECIDITDRLCDGLVYVDLPEGLWRVFFIFERPEADGRVDFTNPESVDLMFGEIYEPHYENLKEYFGDPFVGFFSDEPFIMDKSRLPVKGETASHAKYPWNRYIMAEMEKRYGRSWKLHLPSLFFNMGGISPAYRVAYMDSVTMLYKTCFCDRVGAWCRDHGVMYIGHVVEDHNQHTNMASGGHFFRALDGQDMAGCDVVLHQIVPGMTNHPNSCNCWYDIADPDFFHFSLAKMAASHAHIQPEKAGRAMCEIYGAYGWAEGLKMMKWLTDHMLVRGINNFVPHAFSAKFPDEVPPQFTGAGHNPQFRDFRLIMEYMNRVATLTSDGVHRADCAILYHAETEWSGGDYMYFYKPARTLTLGHIDFDIISSDYLDSALISDGCLCLGREKFPCLVVPTAEYLPEKVVSKIKEASKAGVDVVFLDKITKSTCERPAKRIMWPRNGHIHTISADDLALWMREHGYYDITCSTEAEGLRFYHYTDGDTHAYMLTNEGIGCDMLSSISFDAYDGGEYAVYYPMENKAYLATSDDRNLRIRLEPYESVILVFGKLPDGLPEYVKYAPDKEVEVTPEFNVSLYTAENYPNTPMATFKLDTLKNICSSDMYPHFGGYMVYEGEFEYNEKDESRYLLSLGSVGETAEVWLNGSYVGTKIAPPYKLDVSEHLVCGKNALKVIVTNNLAYEQRDLCSKFLVLEPAGLLGPIEIRKTVKVTSK